MLNIESQPKTQSRSKILAVVLSLCAIAAVVVYSATGKSTSAKNFLNLPDEFVGEGIWESKVTDHRMEGIFRKTTDANGEWKIDSQFLATGHIHHNQNGQKMTGTTTYTLLDGEFYKTNDINWTNSTGTTKSNHVSCANNDEQIPYGRIKSALDQVYDFSMDELTQDVRNQIKAHCPEGSDSNIVNFEDNFYTVCGSLNGKHGLVKIIAEEWIGTLTLSQKSFNVVKPDPELTCAKLDPLTLYTPEGSERSRTLTFSGNVENEWLFNNDNQRHLCRQLTTEGRNLCFGSSNGYYYNPPTRSPTSVSGRGCTFIHGLGKGWGNDWGFTESFTDEYWELSETYTPGCSSYIYYKGNSNANNWYSSYHSLWITTGRDCAKTYHSTFDSRDYGTLSDEVIVTHSMGNLMFGSALKDYCQRSSTTSKWISQAGPFRGSRGASGMGGICITAAALAIVWSWAPILFLNAAGMCNGVSAAPGFVGLYPTNNHLSTTTQRANNMNQATDSKICGTSYASQSGGEQLINNMIRTVTLLQNPNDGLVARFSCHNQHAASSFGSSWTSNNYNMSLGHGDCTSRHANVATNNAKRPAKWMAERTGGSTGGSYGLSTSAPTGYPVTTYWGGWGW